MGQDKELIETIKERNLQYLGYVIRGVNNSNFANNSSREIYWEKNEEKKADILD